MTYWTTAFVFTSATGCFPCGRLACPWPLCDGAVQSRRVWPTQLYMVHARVRPPPDLAADLAAMWCTPALTPSPALPLAAATPSLTPPLRPSAAGIEFSCGQPVLARV